MSDPNTPPDGELIHGYLQGDNQCFDELYERYRRPLYSYLNGMLPGQASTVDDLYQKTWVKVVNQLRRYRHQGSFLPWLYRIAHNTAIDHFRRWRRASEENLEDLQLPADEEQPWQRLNNRELAQAIDAAVATLPGPQREVFLLRQRDVAFKDIAKLQKCSINTALGRMHYAVKRLRAELSEWR